MDVGIYALQATMYLTGEEPISATATEVKTDPKKFSQVEETIGFQLKYPSGVLANCVASYNVYDNAGYNVYCDKGSFGLEHGFYYGGIRGFRSDNKPLQFEHVDHFAKEIDDFAQCIMNNKPTIVPGAMGLRDVRIMLKIYEALRTGKSVSLV